MLKVITRVITFSIKTVAFEAKNRGKKCPGHTTAVKKCKNTSHIHAWPPPPHVGHCARRQACWLSLRLQPLCALSHARQSRGVVLQMVSQTECF